MARCKQNTVDLQDYSRPLKSSSEEINFRNLIDDLLVSTEIDENIKIASEIVDDIQNVKADPDYLKRILTNLVINAEQAMPNGGKLTISARKQKEMYLITVEDTGEGISEDVQPHIFQPLFTTKSKGQGFGLAASKRLATAMGGDINSKLKKEKAQNSP